METKHTPTPWSSENGFISAKGAGVGGLVAKVVMPVVISADQEHMRDANAEFIIRACNSHEQLVAALKYAKMRLELADEDRFDKTTLQQINEALAAAGEA